jgi:hypothetical protein
VVSVRAVKEYCNLGIGSTDVTLRVLEEDPQGEEERAEWWEEEGEERTEGRVEEEEGGGEKCRD